MVPEKEEKVPEKVCYDMPTKKMSSHLKPLYVGAHFDGVPVSKVLVDMGATVNSKLEWGKKDWIHGSMCVPSSLHQFLQCWHEDGSVEIVQADVRPLMASANAVEAKFYEDDIGPLYFTGSNKNGRPTGVSAQKLIDLGAHDAQADGERPIIDDFFSLNE
ncbi:unnamed protein product [Prunus armeniaca]